MDRGIAYTCRHNCSNTYNLATRPPPSSIQPTLERMNKIKTRDTREIKKEEELFRKGKEKGHRKKEEKTRSHLMKTRFFYNSDFVLCFLYLRHEKNLPNYCITTCFVHSVRPWAAHVTFSCHFIWRFIYFPWFSLKTFYSLFDVML